LEIVECVGSLKRLARTGWMQRGVPASIAESVAEHSFESSMIALVLSCIINLKLGRTLVSPERAAALALVHDVTECVTGDIPLFTSKAIGRLKEEIDVAALREILPEAKSAGGALGEIEKMLEEIRESKTAEALIARISERLATLIEARRLSAMGYTRVRQIEETVRADIEAMLAAATDTLVSSALRDAVRAILESG